MPRYKKKGDAVSVEHTLAVEYVDLADLILHPRNPRKGNVDVIAESLVANGQYRPLVVSRATGHIVAGNHTARAARRILEGWGADPNESDDAWHAKRNALVEDLTTRGIAVVHLDGLTPEQELRILVVDNRASDLGTYEDDLLLEALRTLEVDLVGTGYVADDLDDLAALIGATAEVNAPGTDAHDNETPEQAAQRAADLANYQSLGAQGMQEMILVMTTAKKEQALAWIEALRAEWGPTWTNGEVVHAALARAAER